MIVLAKVVPCIMLETNKLFRIIALIKVLLPVVNSPITLRFKDLSFSLSIIRDSFFLIQYEHL